MLFFTWKIWVVFTLLQPLTEKTSLVSKSFLKVCLHIWKSLKVAELLLCKTNIHIAQAASFVVCDTLYYLFQQCNQELITDIKALLVQTRKRKQRRVSHRSPTAPTSSSASSPSPPPAPLKHVTTSEIPEGAPSPGTGDYDQHGKLIILVEDFFYGKDPGHPVLIENDQVPIIMKCKLCDKKLKNNIK